MYWFFKRKGQEVICSQDSTTFSGDVTVEGTTTLTGTTTISDGPTISGMVSGEVTFSDAVTFSDDVTNTGGISGAGAIATTGGVTVTGGAVLQGINFFANDGTPEAAVTAVRKGDLCVDYTNANLYVFAGTAGQNTGWKLVTRATE
jgi:hypothetical protein